MLSLEKKLTGNKSLPNEAVLEFMRTRRSVPFKLMAGPKPNEAQIKQILEIAVRVPDHGKLAPWRYVLFDDNAKNRINEAVLSRALEENGSLSDELKEVERTRFPQSQAVLCLISSPKKHPKVPVWEQELSTGASAMSFIIAANALGFDVQWYTGWYASDKQLQNSFGVQEGERVAGFLHIGTRTMLKTERPRPRLEDIFTVQNT